MLLGTTIEPGTTAEPEAVQSTTPEPKILWIDINSLKQPSAFVPVALSLAAFLLVLGNSIFLGMGHAKEGSITDSIFQVLMGAQLPVVIFLAVRRLRRYPRETLGILTVQGAAAFLAFAVDFILT
jgi:hypothetical protein